MSGFFVKTRADAKVQGPYSSEHLRQLAKQGKLKPRHLVSQDQETWYRVSTVKGLSCAGEKTAAAGEIAETHNAISQAQSRGARAPAASDASRSVEQTEKSAIDKDTMLGCSLALGCVLVLCPLACAAGHWVGWVIRWCFGGVPPVEITGMWLLTWFGSALVVAVIPGICIGGLCAVLVEAIRDHTKLWEFLLQLVIGTSLVVLVVWPFWYVECQLWSRRQRVVHSRELSPVFEEVFREKPFRKLVNSNSALWLQSQPVGACIVGPTIIAYAFEKSEDSKVSAVGPRIINLPEVPHVQARNPDELQTLVLIVRELDAALTAYVVDWPSRTVKAATHVYGSGGYTPSPGAPYSVSVGPNPQWRAFRKKMKVLGSDEADVKTENAD